MLIPYFFFIFPTEQWTKAKYVPDVFLFIIFLDRDTQIGRMHTPYTRHDPCSSLLFSPRISIRQSENITKIKNFTLDGRTQCII